MDHPAAGTVDPDDVTDAVALALIVSGVPLVQDACGCGGGCGLTWFTPEVLREYARRHPMLRRKKDSLRWSVAREESIGDLHLVAMESMRWLEEVPRCLRA